MCPIANQCVNFTSHTREIEKYFFSVYTDEAPVLINNRRVRERQRESEREK